MGEKTSQFEQKITGRVKKLWDTWKEYYGMCVWKNEHLAVPLFLNILGTALTSRGVRQLYSARYNTLRVHPLFIQNTGSGKSEAMKAANSLMEKIGLKGDYLTKTTDAGLVGTIVGTPSKPKPRLGILADYDYLFWDEGTVLLRHDQYNANLQDIIQMAADEPGMMTKILALGRIRYDTTTSICAGTYYGDIIAATIFERGLLQRMLVSYREITMEDIADFNRNKHKLIGGSNQIREARMQAFCDELKSINPENALHLTDKKVPYVKFEDKAAEEIGEKIADKTEKISGLFDADDYRVQIMSSFLARSNQALHVAAILAATNDKMDVGTEELEVGADVYLEHLHSVNNLLFNRTTAMHVVKEPRRWRLVQKLLNGVPAGFHKTVLCRLLAKHPDFDAGITNAHKFVEKLVGEGKLVVQKDKHNGKRICLPTGGKQDSLTGFIKQGNDVK